VSLLRAHQRAGVEWLKARDRAFLWDAPRVGKTRTLLVAAAERGHAKPLVICPAAVRTAWRREAEAVGLTLGLVYSYEEVTRGGLQLMAKLMKVRPDLLIVDEHHYCKHVDAKRTQVVFGKDGYANRIPAVWMASGTPMPKANPLEIWPPLARCFFPLLQQAGLTTADRFRDAFCVTVEKWVPALGRTTRKVVGVKDAARLDALVADVRLRRTLADVSDDVPALDFQLLTVDRGTPREGADGPTLARVAAMIEQDRLDAIADEPHVTTMRRLLGEQKAGPVGYLLRDQLADDATGGKVCLFAHHRSVLEPLRALLADYGLVYVDGDTTPKARDAAIDAFQTDPAVRVFLGQSKACETGITLDAATRAVLVEPSWTASDNVQLGNRIMNTRTAGVRRTVEMVALAGTLDEAIVAANRRETQMAAALQLA